MLTSEEIALGRGRAYALLAELVARGPSASTLPAARASERLARALDSYAEGDEAAADHHHVFSMSVPPYEGLFLDPEGRVGAAATTKLRDVYAQMGFAEDPRKEGAEHLATELRALGYLQAREATLTAEGRVEESERLRAHARALLDEHLLRWLPSFAAAVAGTGRALPSALVDQIVDVVTHHRAELGPTDGTRPVHRLEGDALDLDDPSVGVREIAAALSIPARAGLLVSRADIARVGRERRVPRGFGERRTLLHNLLRSAIALGVLAPTVDGLRTLLAERRKALTDPRYHLVPDAMAFVGPWLARIDETDAALARLAAPRGVGEAAPSPTP